MTIKMTTVTCNSCGSVFQRPAKEVKRCIARGRRMFCKASCQSTARNIATERDAKCTKCDADFVSHRYKGKWSAYCSRSCASISSVTERRLAEARRTGRENAGNLLTVSETMKRREHWKYQELASKLAEKPHEFEFPLDGFVFDLMLREGKMLIEFDGSYHRTDYAQFEVDRKKDLVAMSNGFTIVRIPVETGKAIPVESLSLIENARKLCA